MSPKRFLLSCLCLCALTALSHAQSQRKYERYSFRTLAGLPPGSSDGQGAAARFNSPVGVAVAPDGAIYVADSFNNTIRRVTPDGTVSTIAGLAGEFGFVDGTSDAARFNGPTGIAVDAAGNLYVADLLNNAVRKVTPAGVVTTGCRRCGWKR